MKNKLNQELINAETRINSGVDAGSINKKAVVIIPNYNGAKYISACLLALREQTCRDFSVCVVDNGSADGSDKTVSEDFPEAELIRLKRNAGFAAAVNEGIRTTSSEYVILLNNDTEVSKNFVENLIKAIDNSKSVFACQAKMLSMRNREVIDSAGDLYCALGWAFALGRDKGREHYEEEAELFSACAGAAIYRRSLFEKTGLFDEKHFCYLEDVDLCYRARINGYKVRLCPGAIVYHAGSGTSGSRHNAFKVRLSIRNNIYLIYKNMPFLQLLLNLPLILAGYLVKLFYFAGKGLAGAYLQGTVEGFLFCRDTAKYKFRGENFRHYLRIQLELWVNTIRRMTG
ncbi:MAG TPA: glycosyltransferase family 2 protein [Lachnospiraceae bacterium]|nr:glycosyltransferase family 2 protein [Lachnospiraceae bacterium]